MKSNRTEHENRNVEQNRNRTLNDTEQNNEHQEQVAHRNEQNVSNEIERSKFLGNLGNLEGNRITANVENEITPGMVGTMKCRNLGTGMRPIE
jgi:hypothetical protein